MNLYKIETYTREKEIAENMVEEAMKLGALNTHILPIWSSYRYDGNTIRDKEHRIDVLATDENLQQILQGLEATNTYDIAITTYSKVDCTTKTDDMLQKEVILYEQKVT